MMHAASRPGKRRDSSTGGCSDRTPNARYEISMAQSGTSPRTSLRDSFPGNSDRCDRVKSVSRRVPRGCYAIKHVLKARRRPTIAFPTRDSQLSTPDSRLPTPRLSTLNSQLSTLNSQLPLILLFVQQPVLAQPSIQHHQRHPEHRRRFDLVPVHMLESIENALALGRFANLGRR